jgi:hypothetical protein
VLIKIFGPKSEEVTSGSKKLTDKLLYDSFSSPYNSRAKKLRGMKWTDFVANMR